MQSLAIQHPYRNHSGSPHSDDFGRLFLMKKHRVLFVYFMRQVCKSNNQDQEASKRMGAWDV